MTTIPTFSAEYKELVALPFRASGRLRAYKAFYEAGVHEALRDALLLCQQLPHHGDDTHDTGYRSVPGWVLDGMLLVVQHRIDHGLPTGKKGPHASEKAQTVDRQKHFVRYLNVLRELREDITLEVACSNVCNTLNSLSSPYAGAEETIIKSFNIVRSALKDKDTALQYYAGWRKLAYVKPIDGKDHWNSASS